MATDGLTKPLPPQKYSEWVQDVLNMRDISDKVAQLGPRKDREDD